MAESQAKIVIDADAARVIAEAVRAQRAVKGIGVEAKGVGKAMEKWGGGLVKSLFGVGALVAMIRQAAEALKKVNAEAAAASKTSGGGALARSMAAGKLGVDANAVESYAAGGYRSRDEQTSLLTALGEGGPLDQRSVARATAAFGTGMFDQGEVVKAARDGSVDSLFAEGQRRRAAMSPEALAELELRSFENRTADGSLAARQADGARQRGIAAVKDNFRARNAGAGAALDAFGNLPFADARESGIIESRNRDTLETIARNTAPRPAVAPAVGKD
ncbi:hypothetical protein [Methylibium sp.]|uniref:hypothetical protein n=1 Tax=Methylibium sp. TaxID=2067992 RepID=UPI001839A815|nr:hypothetical protein [Methylibium sp.]MBA3588516.1 hypothetical protein [Methylibium sp.]